MRAARFLAFAVAASAAVPGSARAAGDGEQAPRPAGPYVGLRAGAGVPWGDLERGGPALRDRVERKIPLVVDLGYRFAPRLWAGLYVELAPWGSAADGLCAGGASCSASDLRAGVVAQLRLAPRARVDPWLGIGAGFEVLNASGRDPATGAATEWSWAGIEAPLVEAGVDVAVGERTLVGPYVSASSGQFTSASQGPPEGSTTNRTIPHRGTHGWLVAGLKATLRL